MFHEVLALVLSVVNLLRADTRDLVSMTMAFDPLGCLCDDRFTGVLFISSISDGLSYGYMIPSLIPVVVCHPFPLCGRVSLYEYLIEEDDGITFLTRTTEAWWRMAPDQREELSPNLLELCEGTGAMGRGASFLGGQVHVAVDHNDLACQHLRANQHGTILQLDMTDPANAKLIHQACPEVVGTVLLGFPCQPYSTQGHQMGSIDGRYQVFQAGMRIIYMIQPQSAILECVVPARENADIQQTIQQLATIMNWDALQLNLNLSDRWPCRRFRWWVLFLPHAWNLHGLSAWPSSMEYENVGSLFTHWGLWSDEDEQELQLYAHELEAYLDPAMGADKRLLEMDDIANTLLHSYSNALTSCPCRCRTSSFSKSTLLTKGLKGYFVISVKHNNPRYLHPKEAALLLGIPPTMVFPHPVRASLALLGLAASPLQLVWIYGHPKCNAAAAHGQMFPSPEEWLRHYCVELLRHSCQLFHQHQPDPKQHLQISTTDGPPLLIVSSFASTAAHLLQANRIILGWNEAAALHDEQHRLALHERLDGATYTFVVEPGVASRLPPSSQIMVSLRHQQDHTVHQVPAGHFLFELLAQLNLHHVRFLVDLEGRVYGADYRVWRPLCLMAIDPANWPPRIGSTLRGNGLSASTLGLHDGHVWETLQQLVTSQPTMSVHLVHPCLAAFLLGDLDFSDLRGLGLGLLSPQVHASQVACTFAARGHWALIWATRHHRHYVWSYHDGLLDHIRDEAHQLAMKLTGLFGGDTMDFHISHLLRQRSPTIYVRHCGTLPCLLPSWTLWTP